MNPNICNNCGGNYIYQHGRWVCQSCGSYKPEELSNEEVTLLYTAYQKLRIAEFAEAEIEFDDILEKYPQNPNAYWGRMMAKYGIKYEQDFDGRMIPTCYATSIESILSAQDYQRALQYADEESKTYYREQAEYIERVRKEWVEKAKKEKPYDIFICYKDSDLANGIKRTQDSYEAQELYTFLTDLGYHVFYSHITLRDKVGEKYEPYIFNALSTAKVMIVYGSKPEYITSTWLKNEWTRYQKRIKLGEKNPGSLLVACEGFSPNELPTSLSSMQCFDASDKMFYRDLEKRVIELLSRKKSSSTPKPSSVEAPKKVKEKKPKVKKEKKKASKKTKRAILTSILLLLTFAGLFSLGFCVTNQMLPLGKENGLIFYWDGFKTCYVRADWSNFTQTDLVIPEEYKGHRVVKIRDYAFSSCDTLTNVTIPSSVTNIGEFAFYNCSNLKKVSIPDSVTSLGTGAFYNCINLESIKIPNGLTVIGEKTFAICKNLKTVELPKTISTIGVEAFANCHELDSISFDGTEEQWNKVQKASQWNLNTDDYYLYYSNNRPSQGLQYTLNTDGQSYTVAGIGTCTDTDIIIPRTYNNKIVNAIGTGAFQSSTQLTSISLPNSITSIGNYAFRNCYGLKNITISDSVTSIGYYAFYDCSGLTSITIPNSVTSIEAYTFHGCSSLTSITISDNVTSIADSAFRACSSLTSVVIGKKVTRLGTNAFYGCSNLINITFTGTTPQWKSIYKDNYWKYNVPASKVTCYNGSVTLS